MTSLLSLISAQPARTLSPGEILLSQGDSGGDLFVLETGRLVVERDGVTIATLTQPGTTVGEMSVLLGTKSSATVRADGEARLRVIRNAQQYLETEPKLTFRLAALVAGRLDATSALVVQLSSETAGKGEQGALKRIFSSLFGS